MITAAMITSSRKKHASPAANPAEEPEVGQGPSPGTQVLLALMIYEYESYTVRLSEWL